MPLRSRRCAVRRRHRHLLPAAGRVQYPFQPVQLSNWLKGGWSNISLLTKFDQNWNYDRAVRFGQRAAPGFGLLDGRRTGSSLRRTTASSHPPVSTGPSSSGFVTFMASVAIRPGYAMEMASLCGDGTSNPRARLRLRWWQTTKPPKADWRCSWLPSPSNPPGARHRFGRCYRCGTRAQPLRDGRCSS